MSIEKKNKTADKPARSYNSPRRQEQSANTRARIIQAAMLELREKGFAEMSLDSIAKRAGVASQTVYGFCCSKKGVLDILAKHYPQEYEGKKGQSWQEEAQEHKPKDKLLKNLSIDAFESRLPLYRLARDIRAASSRHGQMAKNMEQELYEQCLDLVRQLAEENLLRPGLDEESAAQICWAIHAPEIHRRLIDEKNWDRERYGHWFAELLANMLLKPEIRPDLSAHWLEAPQAASKKKQPCKNESGKGLPLEFSPK